MLLHQYVVHQYQSGVVDNFKNALTAHDFHSPGSIPSWAACHGATGKYSCTVGGNVFCVSRCHKFLRETLCPMVIWSISEISAITMGHGCFPGVITEFSEMGDYHGTVRTRCLPWEFVRHGETRKTLPPAVLYMLNATYLLHRTMSPFIQLGRKCG